MANIVTISGEARHGKDTFAGFLKTELEKKSKKVIIFHYADFLKYIAKQWYNWDGQKDEKGRSLLQYLGTDLFRKNRPDCWVNMAKEFVLGLGDSVDYVLIPDTRFPNEIEIMQDIDTSKFTSIKVVRTNFDNGLTAEQKSHPSETALNDYVFDLTVENIGTEEDLSGSALTVACYLTENA